MVYWCVWGILKYCVLLKQTALRSIGGRTQSCPPMLEVRISNSSVGPPSRFVTTKLFGTRDVSGNIGTILGRVGSICAAARLASPSKTLNKTDVANANAT